MRYRKPEGAALLDYLSDEETQRLSNLKLRPAQIDARARSNAWLRHREEGAAGRLRWLAEEREVGASVLLKSYASTCQTSAIVAHVARITGAKFKSQLVRHDLSGEALGVRVTVVSLPQELYRDGEAAQGYRDSEPAPLSNFSMDFLTK
jgi:hypothetical protein